MGSRGITKLAIMQAFMGSALHPSAVIGSMLASADRGKKKPARSFRHMFSGQWQPGECAGCRKVMVTGGTEATMMVKRHCWQCIKTSNINTQF